MVQKNNGGLGQNKGSSDGQKGFTSYLEYSHNGYQQWSENGEKVILEISASFQVEAKR